MKEIIIDGIKYLPTVNPGEGQTLAIGNKYFIRNCTYHYVGRVIKVEVFYTETFVWLDECSWVADSGRFFNAISEGIDKQDSSEIEPIEGIVRLNISAMESIIPYSHKLPTKQR